MCACHIGLAVLAPDMCYNPRLGGCKHAKTKHAKASAQDAQVPRRLSTRSSSCSVCSRGSGLEPGEHAEHAKSHRYIGRLMERPKGTSMVNSQYRLYTLHLVTLATLYSRVPYSFDIGLNSLTTPLVTHPG